MGKRKDRKKLHIHLYELMVANAKQARIIKGMQEDRLELLALLDKDAFNSFFDSQMPGASEAGKPKRH